MEKLIESLYRRIFRLEKELERKEEVIKKKNLQMDHMVQTALRYRKVSGSKMDPEVLLKEIDWMLHGMYGCPETCPIQIFGSKKGNNAQHDS